MRGRRRRGRKKRRKGGGVSACSFWTLLETNDVTHPERSERQKEGELDNSRDNGSEGSRDMT